MQWILQSFEDTAKLAEALDRLEIPYTWHKVVPFLGELIPEPVIADPSRVVMFGSYTLWRYAQARDLRPGVFTLRPFVHEAGWQPYLLNGPGSLFMTVRQIADLSADDDRDWFVRPVADSKEVAGNVWVARELADMARSVLSLDESEIPAGSLRHDTLLMLSEPVRILKEWRVWIVGDDIVTFSLYKEGARVVYRPEIDDDALAFARRMIALNPGYAPAYVIDVCRTDDGMRLLETNCINAAGFYAADLIKLAAAIDNLGTPPNPM